MMDLYTLAFIKCRVILPRDRTGHKDLLGAVGIALLQSTSPFVVAVAVGVIMIKTVITIAIVVVVVVVAVAVAVAAAAAVVVVVMVVVVVVGRGGGGLLPTNYTCSKPFQEHTHVTRNLRYFRNVLPPLASKPICRLCKLDLRISEGFGVGWGCVRDVRGCRGLMTTL